MKYKLWYACYIDLLKGHGIAAAFIEYGDQITGFYLFDQETTINRLSLLAVIIGLYETPVGCDIEILGNLKYISEVLKRIGDWVQKDEIDIKSHSGLLKDLWSAMSKKGSMSTQYWISRRSDPMLWTISQAAGHFFCEIQHLAVKEGRFPNSTQTMWELKLMDKKHFISAIWKKPLTDSAFEKLILKNKSNETGLAKIYTFPKVNDSQGAS